MNTLPLYVSLIFSLTTFLAVYLFLKASGNSRFVLFVILIWLVIQSILGLSGFYTITNTTPPRFVLAIIPPLLLVLVMFVTKKGKQFIDRLDLKTLTILHVVRIPVELVLFWLSVHKTVPQLMTFEGRNFDVLSGLTAPIVYFLVFVRKSSGKMLLIVWNLVCLALLFNIVIHAILSFPFNFQKLAFDQPNIALLYFPFIWLPACVVPLVLLSHLAALRQLLIGSKPNLLD